MLQARDDIQGARWKLVVGIVVSVVMSLWWADVPTGVLWFLFITFVLYRWDDRILGAVAVLLLVACPVLTSVNMETVADQSAVYAFLFLVMTVTLQIITHVRDGELAEIPEIKVANLTDVKYEQILPRFDLSVYMRIIRQWGIVGTLSLLFLAVLAYLYL
jgi:hypothetical protein